MLFLDLAIAALVGMNVGYVMRLVQEWREERWDA